MRLFTLSFLLFFSANISAHELSCCDWIKGSLAAGEKDFYGHVGENIGQGEYTSDIQLENEETIFIGSKDERFGAIL